MFTQEQERYMRMALDEAQSAAQEGEIPIGAVVVCKGRVIARAHNLTERLNDVTAHAEMQAITAAMDYIGGKYLDECTLYVTLEPCPMCASALNWAQLGQLVFGAEDPKRGYLYWERLNEWVRDFQTQDEPEHGKGVESADRGAALRSGQRGRAYLKNGMLHPKTEVQYGLLADECRQLMQNFFKTKR